jgi:hypothetical protein
MQRGRARGREEDSLPSSLVFFIFIISRILYATLDQKKMVVDHTTCVLLLPAPHTQAEAEVTKNNSTTRCEISQQTNIIIPISISLDAVQGHAMPRPVLLLLSSFFPLLRRRYGEVREALGGGI